LKARKIVFIILIVIAVVLIIFLAEIYQMKNSNPINAASKALQQSNRYNVQSTVDLYLSNIMAENNNKYKPVITSGSITKGTAYAMIGDKKYNIDIESIGSLPRGNWSIDNTGTVTGPWLL